VLGNHDLHLLAVGRNNIERLKKGDTLREILQAPDSRRVAGLAAPATARCTTTQGRDTALVHAGHSAAVDA
jgi:bis(5'-nucleosyl)-tetraphosphatase (symmetrical)